MTGIINLDKPPGISSAMAVNKVKRLLPKGTKIGHAGTLDPFATGVLLLLIGKATKSSEALMGQPKSYETTVKLGATTATDDLDSAEMVTPDVIQPVLDAVQRAAQSLVGVVQQRPPAYSALKIGGRRAYDLARDGKTVELAPRTVRIDAIEILSYEWPLLVLRVDCGRGTYIRAIARDLGEILRTGGYLTQLRRTRIGSFTIDRAVALDTLSSEGIERHLHPVPSLTST
jgi:tRNA pseudouridine55 synthase